MKEKLDTRIIQEIHERLKKGENLWRILDQYDLTMEQKLELIRIFEDQKWD